MIQTAKLEKYLQSLLKTDQFRDYGPNGLQVEGCLEIGNLVTGVTASLRLIEQAIDAKADAILVHHGLFWRGQDGRVVGWMKKRLELLLAHQINLFAYHLPLDAHPELGNNAQLAKRLGWQVQGVFGEQDLGCWCDLMTPLSEAGLQQLLHQTLNREPVWVSAGDRPLRRMAWCTGGAQSYFEAAIAAGADAFITGEISEPQTHYAREMGVAYFAAGHHATERYGVQALGEHLVQHCGLRHQFIDVENPA
jgi:dinuclear metal center YbgI/SA1388 family protein